MCEAIDGGGEEVWRIQRVGKGEGGYVGLVDELVEHWRGGRDREGGVWRKGGEKEDGDETVGGTKEEGCGCVPCQTGWNRIWRSEGNGCGGVFD